MASGAGRAVLRLESGSRLPVHDGLKRRPGWFLALGWSDDR